MPRRRKRKLRPAPILWVLLILNLVLGLFFSLVTSAGKVKVLGADPSDRARIEESLQSLLNVPCLRVNTAAVEEGIMRLPDVETATLKKNLFGNDELTLAYTP